MGILLSIIIPTYNLNEYADRLLDKLDKQINEKIEVIVVDDGSDIPYSSKYKWVKIIRLSTNSGGASVPRNVGLDNALGKYISFIDVDDMITPDYVEEILKKMKKQPDIIYLSWKSQKHNIIMNGKPPKWNCSVWCRVFKKDIIKDVRFEPYLKTAEDFIFVRNIKPITSLCIKKQIYIYNCERKGSLTRK